jgi:hypothetical protein
MAEYSYTRLDLTAREIRLLRIKTQSQNLDCDLLMARHSAMVQGIVTRHMVAPNEVPKSKSPNQDNPQRTHEDCLAEALSGGARRKHVIAQT